MRDTMTVTIIGGNPLPGAGNPRPASRIATLFVDTATLVTSPPFHILQRAAYTDELDRQRQSQGQPPLTPAEKSHACEQAVDLFTGEHGFLIRPDPENMPLAFAADEILQTLVPSKRRVRFMYVRHAKVQQALRERGEYWRIAPHPQTPADMLRAIADARIAIGGRPIYYYSPTRGTRHLTAQAFAELAGLPAEGLRQHLIEIRDYSVRHNRLGARELSFYGATDRFTPQALARHPYENASEAELRQWHAQLAEQFRQAVAPTLRQDRPENTDWRNLMFATLAEGAEDTVADVNLPGIPPEFFRQIRWLPGGCIEHGELKFDPILEEQRPPGTDPELDSLRDDLIRGFICNHVREFGSLEYINVGRLSPSLRRRTPRGGHRAYIAEFKHRAGTAPVVRIMRVQKWGICEHLDAGRNLLEAIMRAEDYIEYTLDRRLACWQLGMPMPTTIETRRVMGTYRGSNDQFVDSRIWTNYFEREFIPGIATDKIPPDRLREPGFAGIFADLLGEAAAPNLVVGRVTEEQRKDPADAPPGEPRATREVVFDEGDEILVLDADGQPERLVVADHAGTFGDCERPLDAFVEAYARPVTRRLPHIPDPQTFADKYVQALGRRLGRMQAEYRRERRAFDTLFQHGKQGEGTLPWRWAKALARLDRTDVPALMQRLREAIWAAAPSA